VRRAGALLSALIVLAALCAPAAALAQAPRASLPDIERQVMCTVCGVPLDLADSPEAQREKALIAGLIARGEDATQIKRVLVAQYGTAVLALPPSHGVNLAVYIVPAAVVAAVAAALAVALPRWRRGGGSRALAPTAPALSAQDAARLDEDLQRFE
jgi:cytochrome c-type biogenesis protein CcmH/NrfF